MLDVESRKAASVLLYDSVLRPFQSPRCGAEGEGPVERAYADRTQGIYWMDGRSEGKGGAQAADREGL